MLEQMMKSVIDQDRCPVVLCDLEWKIVYMNPAAVARYRADLTGKDLRACHSAASNEKMAKVLDWFLQSEKNNIAYTSRIERENRDVYMVALRDGAGTLIGFYEKHESRDQETAQPFLA